MVLLGEIIGAEQAFDWGIGSHLAEDAGTEAAMICEKLSRRAPLAMRAAKAAQLAYEHKVLALQEERAGFEALLDTADKTEGIAAFRAGRRAEFKGE